MNTDVALFMKMNRLCSVVALTATRRLVSTAQYLTPTAHSEPGLV